MVGALIFDVCLVCVSRELRVDSGRFPSALLCVQLMTVRLSE